MHFVFIQRLCENGSGPIRRRYYAAIFTSSIPKYKHANIKLQSLSNKSSSHSFLNDGDSKNPSTKYAITHAITKSRLVQQAPLYRGSSLLYFLGISMVQKSDPLRNKPWRCIAFSPFCAGCFRLYTQGKYHRRTTTEGIYWTTHYRKYIHKRYGGTHFPQSFTNHPYFPQGVRHNPLWILHWKTYRACLQHSLLRQHLGKRGFGYAWFCGRNLLFKSVFQKNGDTSRKVQK